MSYFKKIAEKWSHKINKVEPDLKNKNHVFHLENVLLDEGWTWDVINELIMLLEADIDPDTPVKYKIKYRDGETIQKTTTYANAIKRSKDSAAYKAAVALRSGDKSKEDDKEEPTQKDKPVDAQMAGDRELDSDKKEDPKPKASQIYKDIKPGQLTKGGDSEIKQAGLQYGYKEIPNVFKPAPGNAGSMLNEIMSGEVANILEQNPNLTGNEVIDLVLKQFGDTELFKQNKGSKTIKGISTKDIPEGQNRGLYSKVMVAVASGKRKHNKAKRDARQNEFKNPKMENYYGHSESFDVMVNDIKGKKVIGPDGTPIEFEEAEELIRSGGKGDNPSDTATLVSDSDSDRVIMTFHSDKDSTTAIVAQSSAKAESDANRVNVNKLVDDGFLEQEQAEAVMGENKEMVEQLASIEKELKQVSGAPAQFFLDKVEISDALKSVKTDINQDGSADKNKTSTKWNSSAIMGTLGPNKNIKKYLKNKENPGDEELLRAFLDFMADQNKEDDPTEDQIKIMDRLNRRWANKGAPDVDPLIEDIRNRTISTEVEYIGRMDKIKIPFEGGDVGVGTFLEANTIFKQFHLEAVNSESEKGVHKHKGMFETNHGGLAVDGEVLGKCMGGVNNKENFISKFEVGETTEQKGTSGSQKGRVTGSKRIVYAINEKDEKIEIGVKVARTKSGKLGKLQTVYQWSDQMKKCFDKHGKRS